MRLKVLLEHIDCWLCVHLKPWRLRLWWHCLWIRSDEFHPSLDHQTSIVHAIKKSHNLKWFEECSAAEEYDKDLNRRRCLAHERSLRESDAMLAR